MTTQDQSTREKILREIRRTASENGNKPLGFVRFHRETDIRRSEWLGKLWSKWSDAVADAGLTAGEFGNKLYTDDFLLEIYCLATRKYNQAPTQVQLNMFCSSHEGYPELSTFVKRFGAIGKLRGMARNWASEQVTFDDVVPLLPEWVEPAKKGESSDPMAPGYVYLLKSGTHYKIGRSENLEKRIKQITVAMPEPVTLEHAIKTDDPAGIERYWHRRFDEYRANGEWFDLPVSALKSFKRLKNQ